MVWFGRFRLVGGSPIIKLFFFTTTSLLIIFRINNFYATLCQKLLNLKKVFKDCECMQYSLLNFTLFLHISLTCFRNFHETLSQVACDCLPLSKEFCANPINMSTKRNGGIPLAIFERVRRILNVLVESSEEHIN